MVGSQLVWLERSILAVDCSWSARRIEFVCDRAMAEVCVSLSERKRNMRVEAMKPRG